MKHKLLSVLLALAMALTMLPASALAADETPVPLEADALATLSAEPAMAVADISTRASSNITKITGGNDTNITENTANNTVTVSVTPVGTLQWVDEQTASGSTHRAAGWWVGVLATIPDSSKVDSAMYGRPGLDPAKFTTYKDTDTAIQLWGGVQEAWLTPGKAPGQTEDDTTVRTSYTYLWYFNWDGDESTGSEVTYQGTSGQVTMKGVDQTVKLTFDLESAVLMKDGSRIWPEAKGTEDDPFIITAANDTSNGITFKKEGYYRLENDVTAAHVWAATGMTGAVILDLAGHKLTLTDNDYGIIYADEDLTNFTIKSSAANGTIVSNSQKWVSLQVSGANNVVNIEKDVTFSSKNTTGRDSFAILITEKATNAVVNLNGCKIEDANGITINGNNDGNPKITLNGVTIDATGHGIYQAGNGATGDTTITGGSTITGGATGIEVRAGSLKLFNSTVTGGKSMLSVQPNGGGTTTDNAALAVAQHTTKKAINVELSGNVTLTGTAAVSIANPQNNTDGGAVAVDLKGGVYDGTITVAEDVKNTTLTITGGTFNSDVSKKTDGATSGYVPEGYECKEESGKYVVGPITPAKTVTFTLNGATVANVTGATAQTGSTTVYDVNKDAISVTFTLSVPADKQIASVKAGDADVPCTNGTYTISNITANVVVTVTVTDVPATLTVAPVTTEELGLGKGASDLQDGIQVNSNYAVTGTSKYVKEFTGFSSVKDEQQGNYIALKLTTVPAGKDIFVQSKDGTADGFKKLDTDGILVYKLSVTDGNVNPITIKVDENVFKIDLTGITLGLPELPPATAGSDGKATNIVDKNVANDITNTIANVSTGNVDDKGDATPDVDQTNVTITFSGKADAGSSNGGTVDLPGEVVAALQNTADGDTATNNVTVDAKVETAVADITLPAKALETLDGNKTVTIDVTKQEASEVNTQITDEEVKALVNDEAAIVEVTVEQDDNNAFATPQTGVTLTIRIKVSATGNYQVLHINGADVTKMLSESVAAQGDSTNGYYIDIEASHLSIYAAVKETNDNKNTLANLALDGSVPTPPAAKITAKYTQIGNNTTSAEYKKWGSGKLELSNLKASTKYMLQLESGLGRVFQVIDSGSGSVTMSVQGRNDLKLTMFEVKNEETMYEDLGKGVGNIFAHKSLTSGTPVTQD